VRISGLWAARRREKRPGRVEAPRCAAAFFPVRERFIDVRMKLVTWAAECGCAYRRCRFVHGWLGEGLKTRVADHVMNRGLPWEETGIRARRARFRGKRPPIRTETAPGDSRCGDMGAIRTSRATESGWQVRQRESIRLKRAEGFAYIGANAVCARSRSGLSHADIRVLNAIAGVSRAPAVRRQVVRVRGVRGIGRRAGPRPSGNGCRQRSGIRAPGDEVTR